MRFIVGTHELDVHDGIGYLSNENLEEIKVAIKVIRPATKTEYLEFCEEKNVQVNLDYLLTAKFYEIEILD